MATMMDAFSLQGYWERHGARVQTTLESLFARRAPEALWDAMAYSVLAGGKRLRPLLTLAACEAVGGDAADALVAACALELIHTQSLIHDDLPCMDNDTLRRGRPTNHVVYGEALALLAGDGLIAYAFQVLAEDLETRMPSSRAMKVVAEFAGATLGMVAGQVVDVQSEGRQIDGQTLEFIHRHKTGELLKMACRLGGHMGQATDDQMRALTDYAAALGLTFQIVDDILDVVGTAETLGKNPGKDVVAGKATYPALYGIESAREEVIRQKAIALSSLEPLGASAIPMRAIA